MIPRPRPPAELDAPEALRPSGIGWLSGVNRAILTLASLLVPATLAADVLPHPTLPDRLVETRGEFVVEYSPGQETWAEEAFRRLTALDSAPPPPASDTDDRSTEPGTAADMRARRDQFLAAAAAGIGLDTPTELQARTFDTFVAHYALLETNVRGATDRVLAIAERPPRRITIWQRDDLTRRLRAGQVIPQVTYDPETDSGSIDLQIATKFGDSAEVRALREFIASQRLDHDFERTSTRVSARVRVGRSPTESEADAAVEPPVAPDPTPLPDLTYPIVYNGESDAPVSETAFEILDKMGPACRAMVDRYLEGWRDPATAFIVLHETAETGLVGAIIASPDRRWLCDGTANYVAWRVLHDLIDPAFARKGYDLDGLLRRVAPFRDGVDLAGWAAAERDAPMAEELVDAHYTFATRAIFMIAERHGDNAVADLWRDVARTPLERANAQTFAAAYQARFASTLADLLAAAQSAPLPPPG